MLAYDPYIDAPRETLPPPIVNPLGTDPFGPEALPLSPLSGAAALSFTATAVDTLAGRISGSASVTVTTGPAAWGIRVSLGGTALVSFTVSGQIPTVGASDLRGATTLTFTPTLGAATLRVGVSGATSAAFTAAGRLGSRGVLAGSTALTFTLAAVTSAPPSTALSGGTSLTFSPTAIWTARKAISGAASITFATPLPTRLFGSNELVGTTSLTFTASLRPATVLGSKSGSTTLMTIVSGRLTGKGRLVGATAPKFTVTATPNAVDSGGGTGVIPRPASQVKDFVGIGIHQSYPQYAAKPLYPAAGNWQQPLLDLGVTHMRGLQGRQASDLVMMQPLFAAGMKLCTPVYAHGNAPLTGNPDLVNPTGSYLTAKQNIDFVRDKVGPNNVSAFEGLNEYNKNKSTIPTWATMSKTFSKFVYDYSRRSASLDNVKCIPPSVYRREYSAYVALGDMSAYSDDGCGHYYTGVNMPTDGATTMDQFVTYSRILTPPLTMKVFVTEHGYSNENGPNKLCKYLLRQILEFMWRDSDIRRPYIFELFDTDPAPLWGLMDVNLNKRPHYFAVKDFVALFKDTGTASTTALPLGVTAPSTAKLKWLLHQKVNGSYYLTLWREIVSTEADAAAVTVTVTLGSAPGTITHYRPALGKAAVTIPNSATFTVPVSDEPSVVKITL